MAIRTTHKNPVPLFYIVEAAVNPSDISSNIICENTIPTANGGIVKTVTADCVLQSFGVINWNQRMYPWNVVMEGLDNNAKIQNDIRRKQWGGEFGHPDSKDMARQSQIMPDKTSHYIDSYRREGNLLKAHITSAPYGHGFDMYNLLMAGRPWAFSLRAFGGVDSNNVAIRPLTVITYDEVNRPSHKEAYGTASDVVTKNEFTDSVLRESSSMILMESNTIVSEVTNFVMTRSDNIKIAKELFGLNESVATFNGKNHIILEGYYMGDRIQVSVPIETYVRDAYKDIMSL